MELLEVASVPVIIVVVYLLLELYKAIFKSDKAKNFIPVFAGVLGAICGVVLYYIFPDMIAAENFVNAIVIGVVSGLGATGTNQIVKQMQQLIGHNTNTNTNGEN